MSKTTPSSRLKIFDMQTRAKRKAPGKELDIIYQKKSNFWRAEHDKKLLELFHICSQKIKAYKDFLKKSKIDPKKIKAYKDFLKIPSVNRNNYLRSYMWEDLCIPKFLTEQSLVLTSTSGSTGAPFYFPRNGILDSQSSIYHQIFLKSSKISMNKSTLVLVCFGMGVWIGGVITYQAFKAISRYGYPMTILTPGVNKKEIFEALKNLAPKYEQIILCGYPPFMKDVVDEAKENGIDWRNLNMKMIFAAETFSEKFRDYILEKTGMKNIYRDTMNIYGSADLGTMAEETPISILIRRLAIKNEKLYKKIFNEATRLPTLTQYIPHFINFECVNKNIYCSGDNVLPLVRYEIGDNGGMLYFDEMEKIFKGEGLDLRLEARKVGIEDTLTELPFVYVYERTDLSTKLYGAIIYPEYIKAGLQRKELEKYVTGKFTMFTKHDKKQNEYLEINIELKPNVKELDSIKNEVAKHIFEMLMNKSTEYKYLSGTLNERVKPTIIFWPHEHPTHFQTGIKQKWVKKIAT